ncbi:hypothetical protein U4I36_12970 [Stenotrophomonas maltophilia]|uniref:hypothetical protein n=1 Tax=Stenotrophomonas maltophilia TaxID=40324 RepID=UPI000D67299A|nr:hypothetical protein [Stenotrophomonas maltophilia]MBA0286874.1 hypothetical protein [Stenotrophomonas maltophilia]MBA0322689.1 hypothetical protein [Stenotrophomonas maltophilia]MBH1417710.1 hypothetical protein [Stenotrophomonas maltophilia]MBH1813612.1 hypothetical protein [Stenotrophomonas maltophilia]MBH1822599.1 hypothetical protein [Stenotrophomonas maltophilia]
MLNENNEAFEERALTMEDTLESLDIGTSYIAKMEADGVHFLNGDFSHFWNEEQMVAEMEEEEFIKLLLSHLRSGQQIILLREGDIR